MHWMDGTLDLPFSVYRAFFYLRISRWSLDGVFISNKDVFTCELGVVAGTKVWSSINHVRLLFRCCYGKR
jgi:hypothetical protein